MKKSRERLLALAAIGSSIVFGLLVAEIALRFFPVPTGLRAMATTVDNPVFRFEANRNFTFSRDGDFSLANHGRINNAGFINDQNYHESDPNPLLAVIGDSYIEALMMPFPQTVQGRLANKLKGSIRVYSFAASGAPLSQYLVWARYAVQKYSARALVINVVGNDFDESLAEYKSSPGLWRYVPDQNGRLRLALLEFRPGWLRNVATASALARYFIYNLQIASRFEELKDWLFDVRKDAGLRYVGNSVADAKVRRVAKSLAAIDAFFRDLPDHTGLAADRIVFVVDGFRYPDEAARGTGSYFDMMRKAFLTKASALGYEAIDLDQRFFARHQQHNERFEFANDGHWNAIGHQVAAEAVLNSRLLARLR